MALHWITSEDARDDGLEQPRLYGRTWWIVAVAPALLAATVFVTATPTSAGASVTLGTTAGNFKRVQTGYATYLARSASV